ncbi:ATPase, T2SS/T4P/T4SS family [Streptomyces sp. B-S-A8]|uniref:ATPase, T2SS/T4P/T4SS family n=1 Tax=Streptomyces solicavernae TaxID=3043614 RepID=A0ABT6S058_9ACTN|nr:ATPase, T2SS/T4P/T4SS family [Streptomyces sp. B-S-A8]MDI3390052.1 ATPase, T2SS/T4P/T4SS family [Streptomyces sp. B-S-A8]
MADHNGTPQTQSLADLLRGSLQPPAPPATAPLPTALPHPVQPPTATATTAPHEVRVDDLPGALPVSRKEIAVLRDRVADTISTADDDDPMPTEEARRERARALVAKAVAQWAVKEYLGRTPLTADEVDAITQAVYDLVFSAGPLQRYLDDPDVENIRVVGTTTLVSYNSRPVEQVEPVVDTAADLEGFINRLAANSGHRERRLSPASPMVSFRLPDGSRAEAGLLAPEPYLIIRRHGTIKASINDMVQWGSINLAMAHFLHALVLAGKNMLIGGNMGAGKTSLLRALARLIPSHEWITILESDKELYLEEGYEHGQTPHALALEARFSNGELDSSGKEVGRIGVADMFAHSLRTAASRVIVGEVRGDEADAMLEAMSAGGRGTMCTLHADHPDLILPRLVTLCQNRTRESVHELVSTGVHFIVFVRMIDQRQIGGRIHRFVSHITELRPGEDGKPSWQHIFEPTPNDPRGSFKMMPSQGVMEDLANVGFDPDWFRVERGKWTAPLDLAKPRLRKATL